MSQDNPKAPYLKKLRELQGFSRRALGQKAGRSPEAIRSLENGNPGRLSTIAALARALDATVEDLTGRPGIGPEQHEAFLDELAREKKTYGPGDPLYDDDPLIGLSDAELAWLVRSDPEVRHVAQLRLRIGQAIARADEERRRLEAESREDAG